MQTQTNVVIFFKLNVVFIFPFYYRIFEFRIDLANNFECFLQFCCGRIHRYVLEAKHWRNLGEQWQKLGLQGQQFAQTLLNDGWELEKAECMPSWCRVEQNNLKVHGLHQSMEKLNISDSINELLDHLRKTGGLVDSRQSAGKFGQKIIPHCEQIC